MTNKELQEELKKYPEDAEICMLLLSDSSELWKVSFDEDTYTVDLYSD